MADELFGIDAHNKSEVKTAWKFSTGKQRTNNDTIYDKTSHNLVKHLSFTLT